MHGKPFWMIGYGETVWDRTLMAFVPMSILQSPKPISHEIIDRFRYADEGEADAQMDELKRLGCSQVVKKGYRGEKIG